MLIDSITQRFKYLDKFLNEKQKRLYVAAEALSIGRGGITAASKACGLSRVTVTAGCKELKNLNTDITPDFSIRKKGAGRKKLLILTRN